jgi:hypothetical protein
MAVKRWSWTAIFAGTVVLAAAGYSQGPSRHWLEISGNDWRQMAPDARLAYVEGFLAGAAVGQAANETRDSAAVRNSLEELRQSGRLRFPFGANVYASRISDYYWWKNHLPLPTWYAFLEVNRTLGRPISDSMP